MSSEGVHHQPDESEEEEETLSLREVEDLPLEEEQQIPALGKDGSSPPEKSWRQETADVQMERKDKKTLVEMAEEKAARERDKMMPGHREFHFMLVGLERAGKSTLINTFLGRTDSLQSTIALDYRFMRRKKGDNLELCHCWEMGFWDSQLLAVPLTASSALQFCLVLALDLSRLSKLCATLAAQLGGCRNLLKDLAAGAEGQTRDLKKQLKEQAWRRLGDKVQDKKHLTPFPVPLVILGTKYDLFENLESEKRRTACHYLRMVSHLNGAWLQFVTSRSTSLLNRVKATLEHLSLNTALPHTPVSVDPGKPLYVPFGQDSLEAISGLSGDQQPAAEQLEAAKSTFQELFPQEAAEVTHHHDPAKDPNFQEPRIDLLKEQMDAEFRRKLEQWQASVNLLTTAPPFLESLLASLMEDPQK